MVEVVEMLLCNDTSSYTHQRIIKLTKKAEGEQWADFQGWEPGAYRVAFLQIL